jgi:hypothetical protein
MLVASYDIDGKVLNTLSYPVQKIILQNIGRGPVCPPLSSPAI